MNTEKFLADQKRYFNGSYERFCSFGGPCVYFHEECLRAGAEEFLSKRHIELVYATLTAWGMHRMGDPERTKTKLADWDLFSGSILAEKDALQQFRGARMLEMSEANYADQLLALKSTYHRLRLSVSNATVVVNSKALFHLLPDLIPPIDRQYTIRLFTRGAEQWRGPKRKFRTVALPTDPNDQFDLFRDICIRMQAAHMSPPPS